MLVFFPNLLSLTEFQVRYLGLYFLFSVIDDFQWFWMGSLHKNIQFMLKFPKGPFFVLHFSYHTVMNDVPDDVVCNIVIYADETNLYSKCEQSCDLWQQLELASGLESNL